MTKATSLTFAAALLFTFACDRDEAPAPTDNQAAATENPIADGPDQVDPGAHGHGHGHGHGKKPSRATRLCKQLDCSDEQRGQISALFEAQPEPDEAAHEAHAAAREDAHAKLAAAFRADSFDPTVLEQVHPKQAAPEDHDQRALALLTELHAILTPEQREQLAAKIEARGPALLHPGGMGHHRWAMKGHHGAGAKGHHPHGQAGSDMPCHGEGKHAAKAEGDAPCDEPCDKPCHGEDKHAAEAEGDAPCDKPCHGEGKHAAKAEGDAPCEEPCDPPCEDELEAAARVEARVDALCEPISCTAEQKTQLQATLADAHAARGEAKASEHGGHKPLADAFRAETLDPAALAEAMASQHGGHGGRMASYGELMAKVHAILTPEQRGLLADKIAEAGAHGLF